MQLWVDADACPGSVREILFRAAERTGIHVTLVANQPIRTPGSRYIHSLQVAPGFDVADNEIVRRCAPGDLVITSDIPLAAVILDKGAHGLDFRGERYSPETIRDRLNMRDFMETMRASGVQTGGPAALGRAERQAFANSLDRFLTRATRQR